MGCGYSKQKKPQMTTNSLALGHQTIVDDKRLPKSVMEGFSKLLYGRSQPKPARTESGRKSELTSNTTFKKEDDENLINIQQVRDSNAAVQISKGLNQSSSKDEDPFIAAKLREGNEEAKECLQMHNADISNGPFADNLKQLSATLI